MAYTKQIFFFDSEEKQKINKLHNLPREVWSGYAKSVDLSSENLYDICANYLTLQRGCEEGDIKHAFEHLTIMQIWAYDNWPGDKFVIRDAGMLIIEEAMVVLNDALSLSNFEVGD
jgi:hypothetical protein